MQALGTQIEAILVLSNFPDTQSAERMAHDVLERGLAACVNILPVMHSVYRWQGAIESANEVSVMIKTVRARYDELEQVIKAAHAYDVPEIIVLPIIAGAPDYLSWLVQESSVRE